MVSSPGPNLFYAYYFEASSICPKASFLKIDLSRTRRIQMTRKACLIALVFAALVTLSSGTAFAQTVDARKALEAAAKAMGTTNLKSIQFTADGFYPKLASSTI